MRPHIYKAADNTWRLVICKDEWICKMGWEGAWRFLAALYISGDVGRIQRRSIGIDMLRVTYGTHVELCGLITEVVQ